MKLLVLLSLLAVSCELGQSVYLDQLRAELIRNTARRSISDKFKAALEGLKDILKTGNETIGLPVLDPFKIAHQEFQSQNKLFTGTIGVKHFKLDGFSNYIVQNADFKVAKWNVSIDLLWPILKGTSAYDVQGHALNKILVYGSGDVKYEINDFHFVTHVQLKVNFKTKEISVNSVSGTEVTIKNLKLNITGLFYDDEISELASAVISDILPDTIADFQNEITARVNEELKDRANAILKNYTLDDILGLLH